MSEVVLDAFRESPFSIVADELSAACWAGQPATLNQLRRLCRTWANRSDSTLDVIWANLGAGKTHALYHLRHILTTEYAAKSTSSVAYAEVPEHLARFIELYRLLIPKLPLEDIAAIGTRRGKVRVSASLERASRVLALGDDNEQRLARDWLCGGKPGLRELKSVTGIDARIENDVDAEKTLTEIIKLSASEQKRIVILLDEFQRVGHLGPRTREALLSHLRALFSHNPSYLSVVFAVGSRVERTAIELLPPELRTIMGMRPLITMPQMNLEEGREFVLQRLAWYRPIGFRGSPTFPFTPQQINIVLSYLMDTAKVPLIPRTVLQVFGMVYDEMLETREAQPSEHDLTTLLDSLRWNDE